MRGRLGFADADAHQSCRSGPVARNPFNHRFNRDAVFGMILSDRNIPDAIVPLFLMLTFAAIHRRCAGK
jgi:hypothetical protein